MLSFVYGALGVICVAIVMWLLSGDVSMNTNVRTLLVAILALLFGMFMFSGTQEYRGSRKKRKGPFDE